MRISRRAQLFLVLIVSSFGACADGGADGRPVTPKARGPVDDTVMFGGTQPKGDIVAPGKNGAGTVWAGGGTPPAPVPEPATLMLVGAGLVGTVMLRRRRRSEVRAAAAKVASMSEPGQRARTEG